MMILLIMTAAALASGPSQMENRILLSPEEHIMTEISGNLIKTSLPDSYAVAVGRVGGFRGFGYVHDEEDVFYFVDPVQDSIINQSLPASTASGSFSLMGADIDSDNNTEFLYINRPLSGDWELVVVDMDAGSWNNYSMTGLISPSIVGTGDFNGDGQTDVVVRGALGGTVYQTRTIDLQTATTIGSFTPPPGATMYFIEVGRFSNPLEDQLAIRVGSNNLSIVHGNGTLSHSILHTLVIRNIETLQYQGGLDDVAIVDSAGQVMVFNGTNLVQEYMNAVGPASGGYFLGVGTFSNDTQDDLVVISASSEIAYFVNGSDGTVMRYTEQIDEGGMQQATGYIDADNITDLAAVRSSGNPCLIRGSEGIIAYTETLIENPSRVLTFDVNGDSRDDTVIAVSSDVYTLLSDADPPELIPAAPFPLHPTVLDPFVELAVQVDEVSEIELANIYLRKTGDVNWTQPHDGMFSSEDGTSYFAFLVGLPASQYEYYMSFRDVYLNTAEYGNQTNPNTLEMTGHLAWEYDKSSELYELYRVPLMDLGNLSDGSPVLYTLEPSAVDELILSQYDTMGALLDSMTIPYPSGYGYTLHTGLIDDDNVLDPIIALTAGGATYAHVLFGNNFTLHFTSAPSPNYIKTIKFTEVYDYDTDGRDELVLLDDAGDYSLSCMETNGTWLSIALTEPTANELRPRSYAISGGATQDSYMCIERSESLVEIYRLDELGFVSHLAVPLGGYTSVEIDILTSFTNGSGIPNGFAMGCTYWDGTDPTAAVFIFSASTTDLSTATMHEISNMDLSSLYSWDIDNDTLDELFLLSEAGELMLGHLDTSITIEWTANVTSSTPLSWMSADFDGDSEEELILFTDEDERLTAVSKLGEVEREVRVGEVHNPILIDSVDLGDGLEIAAFPLIDQGGLKFGVIRDLDWFYRMSVTIAYSSADHIQGNQLVITSSVKNIYSEPIKDASVYITATQRAGSTTQTSGMLYSLTLGNYTETMFVNWMMGIYDVTLSVEHTYYHDLMYFDSAFLTIRSPLEVFVETGETTYQGESHTIRVSVSDSLDTLVTDAFVTVTIEGDIYDTTQVGSNYEAVIADVNLSLGEHTVIANVTHAFAVDDVGVSGELTVRGHAMVSIDTPTQLAEFVQGEDEIHFSIQVADTLGNPTADARVRIHIHGSAYQLEDHHDGSYSASVDTWGWAPGIHNYSILVDHDYLDYDISDPAMGNVTIVGIVQAEVEVSAGALTTSGQEMEIRGGDPILITIRVTDRFGTALDGLNIEVTLWENQTMLMQVMATPADEISGKYEVLLVLPMEGYGDRTITLQIQGESVEQRNESYTPLTFSVLPYIPPMEMDASTFTTWSVLIFVISLVGLLIYFKVISSVGVRDTSEEGLRKALRHLDLLYRFIVVMAIVGLGAALSFASLGMFYIAIILSVILMGASVLLYGIWLYRDARSAVLIESTLSRKRMILGLWHLFFVPLVVVLIFSWASHIDLLRYYLLEQVTVVGSIAIPTFMTTIFTTFVSSILVVVFNLYKEVSSGLKKLQSMELAGTPSGVLQDERLLMVGKFASSIRIKFLMFLVILAGTTALTLDFLSSYNIGVLILVPVVFLVVIPFTSSKVLQVIQKANVSEGVRGATSQSRTRSEDTEKDGDSL